MQQSKAEESVRAPSPPLEDRVFMQQLYRRQKLTLTTTLHLWYEEEEVHVEWDDWYDQLYRHLTTLLDRHSSVKLHVMALTLTHVVNPIPAPLQLTMTAPFIPSSRSRCTVPLVILASMAEPCRQRAFKTPLQWEHLRYFGVLPVALLSKRIQTRVDDQYEQIQTLQPIYWYLWLEMHDRLKREAVLDPLSSMKRSGEHPPHNDSTEAPQRPAAKDWIRPRGIRPEDAAHAPIYRVPIALCEEAAERMQAQLGDLLVSHALNKIVWHYRNDPWQHEQLADALHLMQAVTVETAATLTLSFELDLATLDLSLLY